jgi:phospholipid/cholesterol/gamma-HCH transport system substrate-binding protein
LGTVSLLLAGGVVFLAAWQFQTNQGPTVTLRVAFNDLGGLRSGAPVRLAGLEIGYVSTLETDAVQRRHVAVLAVADRPELRSGLRADSRVRLVNDGLLGRRLVEIDFGHSGPPLADGAEIVGQPLAGLDGAIEALGRASAAVADSGQQMAALLAEEETRSLLSSTRQAVTELAATSRALRGLLESSGDQPAALLADLNAASRDIAGLANDLRQALRDDTGQPRDLGAVVGHIDRAAANTERITAELRTLLVASGDGLPANLRQTLKDIELAAANLKQITESTRGMLEAMRRLYPSNWFK